MGRRGRYDYDPLKSVDRTTWLVVRNVLGVIFESRLLQPGTDLRAVLTAERFQRIQDGWEAEEMASPGAYFFCSRDGDRLYIGIVVQDVGPPGNRCSTAK